MESKLFTREEASYLLALRTRTVRGVRGDFRGMYPDTTCPLPGCTEEDTLPHILECQVLALHRGAPMPAASSMDIYGDDIAEQKIITTTFMELMETRAAILDQSALQGGAPGWSHALICKYIAVLCTEGNKHKHKHSKPNGESVTLAHAPP